MGTCAVADVLRVSGGLLTELILLKTEMFLPWVEAQRTRTTGPKEAAIHVHKKIV